MPPNEETHGGTGWIGRHPSPGPPGPISPGQPDFIGVKFPAFNTKFIRLQTFSSGTGWPMNKTQTPDEIAQAGLFFAGIGDCTKCYCCGIGLRNWLPGDIPAVEHARWEPGCRYIRWLKGDEFVDNVDENYPRIVIQSPRNRNTTSNTNNPTPDRNEIVNSVLMKPGCHALRRCGYSVDVIKNAITKVLSENGWDENMVTTTQLAEATLNMSEEGEERNNSSDTTTGELRNRVTESTRPTINDGDSDGIPSPTNSLDPLSNSVDEVEKLAAENLRMKTTLTCKICLDATVSVLFLPCGHIVTCSECASRQRKCPICRSKITTSANVHLSNLPIVKDNVSQRSFVQSAAQKNNVS